MNGLSPISPVSMGTDAFVAPGALGALGSRDSDFATILDSVKAAEAGTRDGGPRELNLAELKAPGLNLDAMSDEGIQALQKLRDVTRQFEGIFMKMLFKAMRSSVPENDMFHGGQGEKTFTDMLDDTLIQQATQRESGMGIGQQMYEKFARQVSTRHPMAFDSSGAGVDLRV